MSPRIVTVLGAVCGVGVASCEYSCGVGGTAETVAEVQDELAGELGTDVKLRCPTLVEGQYSYCTATVHDGEELAFPVRVERRGDDIDYTTKRWVPGLKMVELGKHALSEKLGLTVDTFSCPVIAHLPDGAKVRCEAQAEGVTIPVEVGIVAKVRKLTFEPVGGVVFGEKLASVAHEKLHNEGVHAEVTCPFEIAVSVPGKRLECTAVTPDETERTVVVRVEDTQGAVEFATEPADTGGDEAGSTP